MTDIDPERFGAGPDGPLKSLVRAGRDELATPDQLEHLRARLGPVLGGGGGGGGGGEGGGPAPGPVLRPGPALAAKAGGIGLAKGLGLGALGAATIVTVLRVMAAPAQETVAIDTARDDPSATQPSQLDLPTPPDLEPLPAPPLSFPSARMPASHASPPGSPPPASSTKHDPSGLAEVRILTAAQDALTKDPARTLHLCDDHAKRYPTGLLAQEREMLAVEALMGLSRVDDAKKRADAFRATYPESPLVARIDEALSRPPGPPGP